MVQVNFIHILWNNRHQKQEVCLHLEIVNLALKQIRLCVCVCFYIKCECLPHTAFILWYSTVEGCIIKVTLLLLLLLLLYKLIVRLYKSILQYH